MTSSTSWSGREVTTAREYWTGRLRAAGALPCRRCGRPLTVLSRWTVGHIIDRDAGGPKTRANEWPEHARCNFSAGGKIGAAKTNARRRAVVVRRDSERSRGIRGW
ncbi:hypothetical protein CBR64_00130 [Cellulosimicrobium cellulans]|uniref:HNH domain-containing protein n=1 Tax=Cellulosimicrobium cellulans TaxID=1710 RepID=A0A1Y0HS47_CELCE|nr:HNH endonuclease [Cellulosimicrobium cellulans]ARU50135.1 hypothetical protein CBR64_00005 [Cellulosimicrobium cellulans]ARU50159.1 hypothetical protein CBR64_00130 [Cellulosimicrobium cellulans]